MQRGSNLLRIRCVDLGFLAPREGLFSAQYSQFPAPQWFW